MKQGGVPPLRILVVLALCGLICACTQTKSSSYGVREGAGKSAAAGYKIGNPYQIQGVWYYPAEDYGYDETGIASWYGPNFHGKYTANGETFDQNEVTAAHRTLPMPSFVRVTNLENGRSLVVRVNDRGPFAHSRIIDLSRRAAQLLDIEQNGTAKVRVQILADESRALAMQLKSGQEETKVAAAPRETVQAETLPPPGSREAPKPLAKPAPQQPQRQVVQPFDNKQLETQTVMQAPVKPTKMYIQAGAFTRFDNANRVNAALSSIGQSSISQVQTRSGTFFRVRMGPIASVDSADALLEKVISSGYPDAKLVVD